MKHVLKMHQLIVVETHRIKKQVQQRLTTANRHERNKTDNNKTAQKLDIKQDLSVATKIKCFAFN